MLSALMMEAVGFLYMLVITYQAARFHSSEGSLIYIITILKTVWQYCQLQEREGDWQ